MKKQNIGFAWLLMGLIFAVTRDAIFWWIGVLMGIIGLIIVIRHSREDETPGE